MNLTDLTYQIMSVRWSLENERLLITPPFNSPLEGEEGGVQNQVTVEIPVVTSPGF